MRSFIFVLSAMLVACGDDPAPAGGTPSGTDGGRSDAASSSSDGGIPGGPGTLHEETVNAHLLISLSAAGQVGGFGGFRAKNEPAQKMPGFTVLKSQGSCTVFGVDFAQVGAGGGPYIDPGAVSVSGSAIAGGPLLVPVDPASGNALRTTETKAANGIYGSELRVTVAGNANAPAFDFTFRTISGPVVTTAPSAIAKSTDLSVTWSGTNGDGYVGAVVYSANESKEVYCTYPGTATSGVIPASLLQELASGDVTFAVVPIAFTVQTKDGYRFGVTFSPVTPVTTATLQ